MGEVSLLDISKRFTLRVDGEVHTVQALARVNFTVKDGEIVALSVLRLRQDHRAAHAMGLESEPVASLSTAAGEGLRA
jgi:hypothetical protein